MRLILDADKGHLEAIRTCFAEIHFNVQRGGRDGSMDIDDWAKNGLERVDAILQHMKDIEKAPTTS